MSADEVIDTGGTGGYLRLLRRREFRALWVSNALGTAATSMSALALGLLVHAETGSALLTALIMFGPSMMQVVGAGTLMSLADTVPPRLLLTALSVVMALTFAAQAAFDLTPMGRLALVLGTAFLMSIAGGARWGLLSDVVAPEQYALARSAMNVSVGAMQIVGFAVGGVLSALLTLSSIFWLAVALSTLAGIVTWRGIALHAPRRSERASFRTTWNGNRRILGQPSSRALLVALCIPNGLIAGCEALFVPYAGIDASALFVAGAIGMLAGDVLVGRLLTPAGRIAAGGWLRALLAVPFLALVWHPPLFVAALLVGVGSIGYAASLSQQENLVRLTPTPLTGQVLGAESAARVAFQGVAAAVAGALAEVLPVETVIAMLSICSLIISASLTPALRRAQRAAQLSPSVHPPLNRKG